MKDNNQSKTNDEEPLRLTPYKPENQVFQKLHLCDYLGELFEAAEDENKHEAEKKTSTAMSVNKGCE